MGIIFQNPSYILVTVSRKVLLGLFFVICFITMQDGRVSGVSGNLKGYRTRYNNVGGFLTPISPNTLPLDRHSNRKEISSSSSRPFSSSSSSSPFFGQKSNSQYPSYLQSNQRRNNKVHLLKGKDLESQNETKRHLFKTIGNIFRGGKKSANDENTKSDKLGNNKRNERPKNGLRYEQEKYRYNKEDDKDNELSLTFDDVKKAISSNEFLSRELLEQLLQAPLPIHPDLEHGELDNGLTYTILKNGAPPGRFDAYLEIFAGSADEEEDQQGIAHMCEHISYMGSRKRERLFGTGSQTNAFTDFHHTVYFACCPVEIPGTGQMLGRTKEMLPLALDALSEVLEARFEDSRLEKERAAILSEMSMVNTMDYRVECQILSSLHRENDLSLRFPIGKEHLIKSWKTEDAKKFHATHYTPDNAHLYIVGDFDTSSAKEYIQKHFGHLAPSNQNAKRKRETLKLMSRHFPPVTHHWTGGYWDKYTAKLPEHLKDGGGYGEAFVVNSIDSEEAKDFDAKKYDLVASPTGMKKIRKLQPHIFQHENIQAFSFHLFAKRPIERIVTLADYRRSVMKRIGILALQIRLNVLARDDPPFTFVEFNMLDSAREACAVCNLDILAEPEKWKQAITLSLQEIRRLGMFGISQSEFDRYIDAMYRDACQFAAQADRIGSSDLLTQLMESVACDHAFMEPTQQLEAVKLVLQSLTLEEVNEVAAEVCRHVTHGLADRSKLGANDPFKDYPPPSAGIATCPTTIRDRETGEMIPFKITDEDIMATIREACSIPIEPNFENEVVVPSSLMTEEMLAKLEATDGEAPSWLDGDEIKFDESTGIVMKELSNGIKVNCRTSESESQRGSLSIRVPGGRLVEELKRINGSKGFKAASVAVGARTMQEGGAVGPWSREQVELYCVDNLMMVEINTSEDWLCLDFTFPTSLMSSSSQDGDGDTSKSLTGLEAIFQTVHLILTDFKWENDALQRAKKLFIQGHDMTISSLEGAGAEEISKVMWNNDKRFLSISREEVNDLTLDDVKDAITSLLTPVNMEVSIVGDFEMKNALHYSKKYLGSIPKTKDVNAALKMVEKEPLPPMIQEQEKRYIQVNVPDSNPRAFVYVSGRTPNRWGDMADGKKLVDIMRERTTSEEGEMALLRREHKAFPFISLLMIQEIINRRLFSNVREKKQLTYDASFRWHPYDLYTGGWYSVQIAASPESAKQVLYACLETFDELKTDSPITHDNLESAKKVIINKHLNEGQSNRYWADLMSGIQSDSIPAKDIGFIHDLVPLIQAITVKDLQLVLDTVEMEEDQICTCLAISEVPEGYIPTDGAVPPPPIPGGGGRGSSLIMMD